jgi:tRNA (guanosine-2'-O-)-methyltransferase
MQLSQLNRIEKEIYLEYLTGFITPERRRKIDDISNNRTRHLTIVLEDIYQPHNASAVLRSCDCFGVLDVHIIENEYQYKVNPDVALGSAKWLNLYSYNEAKENTISCLESLKKKGYRVVATSPHENDVLINDLALDRRTALVFGNEPEGLSAEALKTADAFVKIPMAGFTESLNISVSAAICLFSLTDKLRKSDINWHLTEEELLDTRIAWAKNTIKKVEIIEQDYLARLNES